LADALVLKLEKLKQVWCASENCGDIEGKRKKPKERRSMEDFGK